MFAKFKPVLKLLLAFLPWLSFLIIAHGSLFRLKLGLIIALLLSVIMGITGLHRGVILWGGLLFFCYATLSVVVFNNMWTAQHMGIIANGVLATSVWFTIALKNPFTLDYAKEHTDPSLWSNPLFIRTSTIIASVWGLVFCINTLLAWGKMKHLFIPEMSYEIINYSLLIGTVIFTNWYPNYIKRRQLQEVGVSGMAG
jgi:hypothetical protein